MKTLDNSARRGIWPTARLTLATLLILQGCALAPQVAQTCPKVPPAPSIAGLDLTEDFLSEIERYLNLDSGPTDFGVSRPNVRLGSPK